MTERQAAPEPLTEAGKLLAGWLATMRRKEYLGVPDPALVVQIEDAARSTVPDPEPIPNETESGWARRQELTRLARSTVPARESAHPDDVAELRAIAAELSEKEFATPGMAIAIGRIAARVEEVARHLHGIDRASWEHAAVTHGEWHSENRWTPCPETRRAALDFSPITTAGVEPDHGDFFVRTGRCKDCGEPWSEEHARLATSPSIEPDTAAGEPLAPGLEDERDASERAFDAAYYPDRDTLRAFSEWCAENGHEEAVEAVSEFLADDEAAADEMGE